MMTLRAILCSLRLREVRAANRLSKNCTLVVTTTGAAQSSMASLSLSLPRGRVARIVLLVLDGRMMLQNNVVAQHLAEDRGGLVDDDGEGDGVDDPLVPMRPGVVEREAERGERLAAAGRHRQREEAGRIAGARTDMVEDFRAQAVDRRIALAQLGPCGRRSRQSNPGSMDCSAGHSRSTSRPSIRA